MAAWYSWKTVHLLTRQFLLPLCNHQKFSTALKQQPESQKTVTIIAKPTENTKAEIALTEGEKYICDFDPNNTELTEIIDGKMILTFADGSQIIISNYVEIMTGQLPPELTLADGTVIDSEELLTEVIDIENLEDEEVVEDGEEDLAALAEQLANVQPAAGESGGSGNSGYGFNSSPVDVPLDSPDAIGPLNPTALKYDAPEVNGDNQLLAMAALDDRPIIGPEVESLDETSLLAGNLVATGSFTVNYGNDGPGSITPSGNFNVSGSLAGGTLSSGGVPVVISVTPTGYQGVAGGTVVFTMDITTGGDYTYTQFEPFDHADGTNDNDVIFIDLGVVAQDADGDRSVSTLRIQVADDAPVVLSQIAETVDETDFGASLVQNGQFYADVGQDQAANAYSANNNFIASGSVAGGTLSSNGVAVTVTAVGNVYTGTAGGVTVFTLTLDPATGEFTYEQFAPLDHANASDPNDMLTLQFGVDVTDFDGDVADGYITVNVLDDAPEISGASESIDEDDLQFGPIVETGTTNPDFNADGAGAVTPTGTFTRKRIA